MSPPSPSSPGAGPSVEAWLGARAAPLLRDKRCSPWPGSAREGSQPCPPFSVPEGKVKRLKKGFFSFSLLPSKSIYHKVHPCSFSFTFVFICFQNTDLRLSIMKRNVYTEAIIVVEY